MASYAYLRSLDSIPPGQLLGVGCTGMVIREGNAAVKLPIKWDTSRDDEIELNIDGIQREQEAYQRLEGCDHVIQVLELTATSIKLELMENGDLYSYMYRESTPSPSKQLELLWFRQMARGLAQIHDRRVLVLDIARRNFLVDSDLSVKFCDFTEATILPLDTCMETANDHNNTVQTDIGQLAAVMYEVVTGEDCSFNSFLDKLPEDGGVEWPDERLLKSTQGIWLGDIIKKCWTRGAFRNAHELLRELESASVEDEPAEHSSHRMPIFSPIMDVLRHYRKPLSFPKMITLAAAVGAVTILCLKEERVSFLHKQPLGLRCLRLS